MALIKCPECGTEVSDKALQCPKCSYPISTAPSQQTPEDIQTIQQTSKRLKKQIIIAVVLIIGGIILISTGANANKESTRALLFTFGTLAALLGAIWYIIVRIRIWWNHR